MDVNTLEKRRKEIVNCLRGIISAGQVRDYEVLIDVPKVPREQDTISNVLVVDRYNKSKLSPFNEVSQVVNPLYIEFTQNVKKARVFISPRLRELLQMQGSEMSAVSEVHKTLNTR